ncbi:MAG: FecCD family ABC transporter permease [Candidatus Muiribacteriota bacterium]
MLPRKNNLKLIIFCAVSLLIVFFSLYPGEKYDLNDERQLQIFLNMRLSRVLLGFISGAILALAGLCFQTLFQNPLASPFTLGTASGAALGAASMMKAGVTGVLFGISFLMLGAFGGALLSVFFIFTIIRLKKADRSYVMLLAGVAFNFLASSIVLFLQYVGDLSISFRLARWTMGSLDTVSFDPVLRLFIFFILIISGILYYYRELDIMLFGEEIAKSRGVDTLKVERNLLILVSIAVGSVTALCGPISFVGLMVPHIVKKFFRINHLKLALGCVFGGGAFLSFCDALSRGIFPGSQLPVGIVTAFLGAPFFLYILFSDYT